MSRLLFQISHLYKTFGPVSLFEGISLSINQGEIFALIGENGAGKTTLLRILAGLEKGDSGQITRSTHLSIGFLTQEITLSTPNIQARTYLTQGLLSDLEQQMTACLDDPARLDEWAELHEKYEHLGGYKRMPIEKALNGLKLNNSLLDLSMASLSSGQRIRIALAKVLIENPDLLLLDEPTNHLDQEMLDWLKTILSQREGATVIVSHDRKFLNATCNRLVEIKNCILTYYGGGYDFYLEEQKQLLERLHKAYEEQEEERSSLKQKIKAMTFSKAKPNPPKDRNIMAYDRRGENLQKSLQRNLDNLKNRLAEIESNPLPNPKSKNITGLRFHQTPLLSSTAIELNEISKAFGEKKLFHAFSKSISKGDRILLTGPNGSGKTTLLRCLAGLMSVDAGSIHYAPSTKTAYLDQEVELLPTDITPLQYFEDRFNISEEKLRKEFHKTAFESAELIGRPFSTLSVGQRKRLMLLSLILERPNVLLLDEPTNHLDFQTIEAFESALINFDGAIVAVSHDTTFINKIATKTWNLC